MKLLIEIPEEAKQAFDCAESNDIKGSFYDHGGVIGNAIKNGKQLDDVLDEIRTEIEEYRSTINRAISEDELKIEGMKEAYADCLEIIDKYKAEWDGEE